MRPVWIFRHVAYEGPGHLADFLQARQIPFRLIAVDEGEPVPVSPGDAAGLVFMGGPMSVNDPLTWVPEEMDLIRRALSRNIPVLGHCLGGQLIARALDGVVEPGPGQEIGWFPVQRVAGPEADWWLGELPPSFDVFHWHGERFGLPEDATPLLTNEQTPCQGFAYGSSLALQCHVEMTPALVRDWADRVEKEAPEPAPAVQTPAAMQEDCEEKCRRVQEVADQLYSRWLEGLRG